MLSYVRRFCHESFSNDTSNSTLGIALIDGDQVVGEYITNVKKNHSVRVMPAIETL